MHMSSNHIQIFSLNKYECRWKINVKINFQIFTPVLCTLVLALSGVQCCAPCSVVAVHYFFLAGLSSLSELHDLILQTV